MTTLSNTFIPELWSEQIIKDFKFNLTGAIVQKQSKGTRLLRAAALGVPQEEIDKIDNEPDYVTTGELYEYLKDEWTNDAADALRYAIDADIMGNLSTGARTK